MPVIQQPEPRGAQVARTLNRHIEVVLYALGVLTGGILVSVAAALL